jgi:hypothetical protein
MPDSNGETTKLEFVIGFLVSVVASIMYAAGLNLLKADHVENEKLSKDKQRVDCCRPKWHLGLYLYVFSQGVGSTIALSKFFLYDILCQQTCTLYLSHLKIIYI